MSAISHHHHHHSLQRLPADCSESYGRALLWVSIFNLCFVAVEAMFGLATSSMGLLSDAGHNLGDCAALLISLTALKAACRRPTSNFTYGFKRATINASLFNALILYLAVGMIIWESVEKLRHPEAVDGGVIAIVAGIGIVVKAVSAWALMRDGHRDLNIRAAYMHMLADMAVGLGVVLSGVAISITGDIIDPITGIVVAVLIAVGVFPLLRDSVRLTFDAVPRHIDMREMTRIITETPHVVSFTHLHVWAVSTSETALTVHVVVDSAENITPTIELLTKKFKDADIGHTAIEAVCN